jgi:hypothetical protein
VAGDAKALRFPSGVAISPGFHHTWKKVLLRGIIHVRSEVDQNAAIVVTKKVSGADYENIRTLTRDESGL